MKFTCQRDSILNEIAKASEFTSSKSNLSIAANIFLETRGDSLVIKATDQKMGYCSKITVQTQEDGSTSVRCDKFLNVLRSLPNSQVTFCENDGQMDITNETGTISFNLRTMQEDFPQLIEVGDEFFRVSKQALCKIIDQTSFSVGTDESKYFMCGALLSHEDNCLVMVGTDGKRLSYIKEPVDTEIPQFDDVTIPLRFLSVIRSFKDTEGDFEVHIDKKIFMIRSNNAEYYTVLINAPFPSYKKVIPTNLEHFCKIRISEMDEALKRVSLFTDSKFKRVIFQIENDRILISTEESEMGMAKEEIRCEFAGTPFKCAMNFAFLQAPLKTMEGEFFSIWFNDPSRAFVIKPEPEREYLHVIMPMQLN